MTTSMISVVIPTRNRSHDVERCLDSLTRVTYSDWDILLVDQSDDVCTEAVVEGFADRLPNLRYWHMSEQGLSRARNLAMRTVRGAMIAFLDDDCTVVSDWLEQVAVAFERHPDAALIFGTVAPAPHDSSRYYTPSYHVSSERILRGRCAFLKVGGIMGASMYLRRALLRNIGPMDIYCGVGARFKSSEDRDYAYRVLAAGFAVVETPSIVVEHHGARDYESGTASRLVWTAPYSQGAIDAKYLRCGDLAALPLIVGHIAQYAARLDLRQIILRRGPTHLAWPAMYLGGLAASFQVPVIHQHRLWGTPNEYDPADLPGGRSLLNREAERSA